MFNRVTFAFLLLLSALDSANVRPVTADWLQSCFGTWPYCNSEIGYHAFKDTSSNQDFSTGGHKWCHN